MREDTPPRNSDDENFEDAAYRMNLAMMAADGFEVEDEEFGSDVYDDDLEEVELEELEHRLNLVAEVESEEDENDENMRATPEDKSILTFSEHLNAIFSCHLHPELDIAVTGSQDDIAYIWDTQSGQVLHKINEHTDTVTFTRFNHDGSLVFTADMAGNIFVYKVQTRTVTPGTEVAPSTSNTSITEAKRKVSIERIWDYSMGDLSWCFWHDRANVLFAGGADTGEIYMWRVPSGDCKVFSGPGCPAGAGNLTEDGKKLFASYNDGSLRLWDLRSGNAILTIDDQHSEEVVAAVACDKNGSLYASGDVEGKILFCTQNGPVHSVRTSGMVECLAFSPSTEIKLLASASLEGETVVWDYGHFTKRVSCLQPDGNQVGVCGMKWLTTYSLAIGTVDGDILIYDARTGIMKCQLTGHRAHIYDFCYDRRTSTMLCASEDGKAKIFALPDLDD